MKVLVVDDDHLTRRLLAQALEKSGYRVLDCRDGVEALQLLENAGPAILVLDYQMPEFNGAQICEIIRGSPDPEIAQVPIILLTAHSNSDHEVECLRAGANDFVTKPVNMAVLKARIDTHTRLYALREQLMEQNEELEKWRQNHERDLEAARLTQQALLPHRLPKLAGWDFATHFHPVIQVGGDIFDWIKTRDGSLLVWISDATGHGASAALLTALSKSLFRRAAGEVTSPAAIVEHVNQDYQSIFKGRSFMTGACLALSADVEKIGFCGAGHPPLLIARGDGSVEELQSSGPPLGLNAVTQCGDSFHEVKNGDALLLHTDGLYDAANAKGERLTQAALKNLLAPARDSAQQWLDGLLEKVRAHADGESFSDDIAAFAAVRTK